MSQMVYHIVCMLDDVLIETSFRLREK